MKRNKDPKQCRTRTVPSTQVLVLTVLWRWVERDPYPHEHEDWVSRVREVWRWGEGEALRVLHAE